MILITPGEREETMKQWIDGKLEEVDLTPEP